MPRLVLRAPAKVNLYLRVLRKRPDGYHDIETLFERVGLFDTVILRTARAGIRVTCSDPSVPTDARNTVYRAARLLQDRCRVTRGVWIHLRKRIPLQAGLGGGSSDAAAVLAGLNRLWRLGLSRRRLVRLAAEIGSDVPFFVLDRPFAVGKGRGENLTPVPWKGRRLWHCLVKPPFGISTQEAYARVRPRALTPPGANVRMALHSIHKGDPEALAALLSNSLEHTLNKRVKSILIIKKALKEHGALGSLLSGSGSTVFGVFLSERAARNAARILSRSRGWRTFAVPTV